MKSKAATRWAESLWCNRLIVRSTMLIDRTDDFLLPDTTTRRDCEGVGVGEGVHEGVAPRTTLYQLWGKFRSARGALVLYSAGHAHAILDTWDLRFLKYSHERVLTLFEFKRRFTTCSVCLSWYGIVKTLKISSFHLALEVKKFSEPSCYLRPLWAERWIEVQSYRICMELFSCRIRINKQAYCELQLRALLWAVGVVWPRTMRTVLCAWNYSVQGCIYIKQVNLKGGIIIRIPGNEMITIYNATRGDAFDKAGSFKIELIRFKRSPLCDVIMTHRAFSMFTLHDINQPSCFMRALCD